MAELSELENWNNAYNAGYDEAKASCSSEIQLLKDKLNLAINFLQDHGQIINFEGVAHLAIPYGDVDLILERIHKL